MNTFLRKRDCMNYFIKNSYADLKLNILYKLY